MSTDLRRKPGTKAPHLLPAEVILWSQASDWLLAPQQDRSRRTLSKILEAAITLFCNKGFTQATIAAISEASGVSIGTIYGRFEDKQAILQAILAAYYRSRREQFDDMFSEESCQGSSLEQVVVFYTDLIFSAFRQDAALILLADAARSNNAQIAQQVGDLNRHAAIRFGDVLQAHADQIRQPDIRAAAMLYHDLISCLARVSIQPTGPVASSFILTDPAIEHKMVTMFLNHLRTPDGSALSS
ncbi:TetR/AcrR family transcriptional regulator [Aquisediminimonas sediminicola]|uniref:TetR/AcrR family transcriptional regulator n=1 Tax=Alteraquisediminimonas sediminicola TaxID=2676787 RepID=UPI001C8D0B8D|nr:TetR/AcrR family transcriptional regulator [Aquisediminimonas sediminicola]